MSDSFRVFEERLGSLSAAGNLRCIPVADADTSLTDFTSNDYLGIALNRPLREDFLGALTPDTFLPTSSASRLLASYQNEYTALEDMLEQVYNRSALLFNSGYHANVGIICALADRNTLFIADKLVHASLIDGLMLASARDGSKFVRFRHNDYDHLEKIIRRTGVQYQRVVIVAESIYSMDGDAADIDRLVAARSLHPGAMLYVDEAHAVGVAGEKGLGLSYSSSEYSNVDIIVGTFGKALASMGAFAVVDATLREFLVNTSRPLIFSTALPPLTARWSRTTFEYSLGADSVRRQLHTLGQQLQSVLGGKHAGHIQPLLTGNADRAVELSRRLLENGIRVLPIRTPTVPPGTERLRFSLSASHTTADIAKLGDVLSNELGEI